MGVNIDSIDKSASSQDDHIQLQVSISSDNATFEADFQIEIEGGFNTISEQLSVEDADVFFFEIPTEDLSVGDQITITTSNWSGQGNQETVTVDEDWLYKSRAWISPYSIKRVEDLIRVTVRIAGDPGDEFEVNISDGSDSVAKTISLSDSFGDSESVQVEFDVDEIPGNVGDDVLVTGISLSRGNDQFQQNYTIEGSEDGSGGGSGDPGGGGGGGCPQSSSLSAYDVSGTDFAVAPSFPGAFQQAVAERDQGDLFD